MFPLDINYPVIMKDGTRKTLADITGDVAGLADEINEVSADVADVADSVTSTSQTGTKATTAITAGTYFYLNGKLVKAKTDIASGATFTKDTNYEEVPEGGVNDLESQISNINSDVSNLTTSIADKATKKYKNFDWETNHAFASTGNHFYLVCVESGDIAFIRQFSTNNTVAYTIYHYTTASTTSPSTISQIVYENGYIYISLSVAKGCVVYEL